MGLFPLSLHFLITFARSVALHSQEEEALKPPPPPTGAQSEEEGQKVYYDRMNRKPATPYYEQVL